MQPEIDDRPIAYDVCSGLGGWTEALLEEGYRVIGFDIEAHDYGTGGYPGELRLRDITTIHGSELKDAALIVCSPPCQRYSYMAMPWSRAKEQARMIEADTTGEELRKLNLLFDTCFRIQREANEANRCAPNGDCMDCDGTGNFYEHDEDGDFLRCDTCDGSGQRRYIPMVVENVRGAQRWVGRAQWHYGSYYLWGDVPALMPAVLARKLKTTGPVDAEQSELHNCHINEMRDSHKVPGFRFDGSGKSFQTASVKTVGHANIRDGHTHTRHLTNQRESDAVKVGGINFSDGPAVGFNVTAAQRYREGVKQAGISGIRENGKGDKWFQDGAAAHGSRSNSRKAASAMIAKIPYPLAQHIARTYKPEV